MLPTLQLPVVIERDEDGYYAYCPTLKGCQTQGKTYEKALENIREAVQLYLDSMKDHGETLPTTQDVSFATVTAEV